jgi:monothiol glutaredoxin
MTNIVHVDDARARVIETIKLHPIVLFMRGSPSHPQCDFSAAVVQTLAHYGVPYHAADQDVLGLAHDLPALRRGRFIGGYDIVLEMHETGELAEALGIHRDATAS